MIIGATTFTCVRCLEPENIVLHNNLGLCVDCLYPRCQLCTWRHPAEVVCRVGRPRGYSRKRRPLSHIEKLALKRRQEKAR